MSRIIAIVSAAAALALGATAAVALDDTFSRPKYKDGTRLDLCYGFGQDCGQRPADTWCRIQGYEKAASFTIEKASPTTVIGNGKRCTGSICNGYKTIVCTTSAAKRGKQRDWPQKL